MNRMRIIPTVWSIGVVVCGVIIMPDRIDAAENPAPAAIGQAMTTNFLRWATSGPAVYAFLRFIPTTNPVFTNAVFDHYVPESLNHLAWTNFLAHTNGRDARIWSIRSHPPGWPTNKAPIVAWNTNGLMWGMEGLTALSPCWEEENSSGQIPVTALTRRHGYTRGHGMGADGFTTNHTHRKVWFVTTNNTVIQTMVVKAVVRTVGESRRDYTLLQFGDDLPASIEPIRVIASTNLPVKYPYCANAPRPFFKTEQLGNVSAEVPGFYVDTWKGGDSGSPDMLPIPGELIFVGGRSTSGPSAEMQADINALCAAAGLNPDNYQLQWVDLSGYPSYEPRQFAPN